MSITTKKGDAGQTEILFGARRSKTDVQVVALGEVDELNAVLGLVRILAESPELDRVQNLLVTLMGELAMPVGEEARYEKTGFGRIGEGEVSWLEGMIGYFEQGRAGQRFDWLRPGADGRELAARLHLARTVARRAERAAWEVGDEVASSSVRIFLNRLSDWLWLWARSLG